MQATCQLCECKSHREVFTKNGYVHLQCDHCRSIYVFPRPSEAELIAFYQQDVEHLSESCWQDSHKHAWDLWKHTLKMAKMKAGLGKLLDIGCGTGTFIRFAQQQGWQEVEGIEVVPAIAALAEKNTGAKIYTTDFWSTPLKSGDYSVIAIWDVIEHLSDVKSNLSRMYDLLKPGGILIIGTVNRDGFSIRTLRQNARTFGPPEHLTFFTQQGITLALTAQKFRDINQWSEFIYLQEWTKFLPQKQNAIHNEMKIREPQSRFSESSLFLFFVKLVNLFLRLTNLGDELVIVAQK